jgi:hypothetical protein
MRDESECLSSPFNRHNIIKSSLLQYSPAPPLIKLAGSLAGSLAGWLAVAVTFAYAAARLPSPAFQLTSFYDPSRLGVTVTIGRCEA